MTTSEQPTCDAPVERGGEKTRCDTITSVNNLLIFLIFPFFPFRSSPFTPLQLSPYGLPTISDPSSLSLLIVPLSFRSLYAQCDPYPYIDISFSRPVPTKLHLAVHVYTLLTQTYAQHPLTFLDHNPSLYTLYYTIQSSPTYPQKRNKFPCPIRLQRYKYPVYLLITQTVHPHAYL
jgi:hypothetical protein